MFGSTEKTKNNTREVYKSFADLSFSHSIRQPFLKGEVRSFAILESSTFSFQIFWSFLAKTSQKLSLFLIMIVFDSGFPESAYSYGFWRFLSGIYRWQFW